MCLFDVKIEASSIMSSIIRKKTSTFSYSRFQFEEMTTRLDEYVSTTKKKTGVDGGQGMVDHVYGKSLSRSYTCIVYTYAHTHTHTHTYTHAHTPSLSHLSTCDFFHIKIQLNA
jgi:hypothetical protein